jgi:hypothetical protein
MIKIKDFEMKSEITEYTLFEFEQISLALNDTTLDYVDKYLKIFEILNVPEEIVDDIDTDQLVTIIKDFNKLQPENNLIKSFELDGYEYVAYDGDDFKLKIKDLALIENYVKKSGHLKPTEVIAILFKRNDLSKTEHYTPAHIKYKIELFKNLNCALVYPYIIYLGEKLVKKLTLLTETDDKSI